MQSNTAKKPLRVYIDENIAPQMAHAFNVVQNHLNKKEKKEIQVYSIAEEYGVGALDEDWLPEVAKHNGIVITQDRRMQHSKHQRELYKELGVGMIFLKAPKDGMCFWNMFKHLVNWWDRIKSICWKNKVPFAYRQPGKNKNFVEWTHEE